MKMVAIHIGFHRYPVRVPPDHEATKTTIALMKQAIRNRLGPIPSQATLTCTLKIIFLELMIGSNDLEIIHEK
jgi:hypothetical protein